MKHAPKNALRAALDIGTSKVACVVGRAGGDGGIEIVAAATTPCAGLKKGLVVDINETTAAIRKVIGEVEGTLDDFEIENVHVGVTGDHIRGVNCEGMAPIKDGEVSAADIERARETAEAIRIPSDRRVLHVLFRDFKVDDQEGVKDPVGMSGARLQANVHIVTAARNPVENVTKCVERCGLGIDGIVLEQLASGGAVLSRDERRLGVCLIDIGAGTTDIALYAEDAVAHTAVIPIGGNHITNDIAVTFRTPANSAEEVKLKYGCALAERVRDDETIEVAGAGGHAPVRRRRHSLAQIIEPRCEELFSLVLRALEQSELGARGAVAGYVLTGGSSKLDGLDELAARALDAPVRCGRPGQGVSGLAEVVGSPVYATGVGLLLHAARDESRPAPRRAAAGDMLRRARDWLRNNF